MEPGSQDGCSLGMAGYGAPCSEAHFRAVCVYGQMQHLSTEKSKRKAQKGKQKLMHFPLVGEGKGVPTPFVTFLLPTSNTW
jgi:hypothetical protein